MRGSSQIIMYKAALPHGGAWKRQISNWIEEDAPSFDIGGLVVGSEVKKAQLFMKQNGIVAGTPFAEEVWKQCGLSYKWLISEGTQVDAGQGKKVIAELEGPANQLLLAERVSLNILSRASGIATRSRSIAALARAVKYSGVIAGTRKTTPGFRIVDKYAMAVGGVDMHRYDLSSMVMLKDNHVWSTGSITRAVHTARDFGGFALKIEVECRSEAEAEEAIAAGADVVMLDNFSPEDLKVAAASLKRKHRRKVLLECSGGLTDENIDSYLCKDIDIYSTSWIHQGTPVVDFSLKINH